MGLDAFARIPSRYGMRVCQQNQREQVRAGAYYGYIVFVYLMRFSPDTIGKKALCDGLLWHRTELLEAENLAVGSLMGCSVTIGAETFKAGW
jgi:hypothetical protein